MFHISRDGFQMPEASNPIHSAILNLGNKYLQEQLSKLQKSVIVIPFLLTPISMNNHELKNTTADKLCMAMIA